MENYSISAKVLSPRGRFPSDVDLNSYQRSARLSGRYDVNFYVESPRGCGVRGARSTSRARPCTRRQPCASGSLSSGVASEASSEICGGCSRCVSSERPSSAPCSMEDEAEVCEGEPELMHVTFNTESLVREIDRLTETIKADLLLDREFDENVAKRQKKFLANLKGIRCGAIRICRQMRRLQQKLSPEKCEQNSKLMECLGTKALSELVQQYRTETLSLKSQLCKALEKYRDLQSRNDKQEGKYECLRKQNHKLKSDLDDIVKQFSSIAHKVDQSDELARQNKHLTKKLHTAEATKHHHHSQRHDVACHTDNEEHTPTHCAPHCKAESLHHHNQTLTTENEHLKRTLDTHKNHVCEVSKHHNKVHASYSEPVLHHGKVHAGHSTANLHHHEHREKVHASHSTCAFHPEKGHQSCQATLGHDTGLHGQHHQEIAGNYVAAFNVLQGQHEHLQEECQKLKEQLATANKEGLEKDQKIRDLWLKIGHLEAVILGLKKKESNTRLLPEEEKALLEQAKEAQEHIIQASPLLSPGNSAPSHHKSAQAKQCTGPPLLSDQEREDRRNEKKLERRKSKAAKPKSSRSVKAVPSETNHPVKAVPSKSRERLLSHHGILGYHHPHDPDQHVHFMSGSSHRHLHHADSKPGLSKKSSHKLRPHENDDERHGFTSTHLHHHPQDSHDDTSVLEVTPRAEDSHVGLRKKKSKKEVEKRASRHHDGEDSKPHLQMSSHGHFYNVPDDQDNDVSHLISGIVQGSHDEDELEREEKPKKVRSTTSKKHLEGKKSKKDVDELNRSRPFSLSRDEISSSERHGHNGGQHKVKSHQHLDVPAWENAIWTAAKAGSEHELKRLQKSLMRLPSHQNASMHQGEISSQDQLFPADHLIRMVKSAIGVVQGQPSRNHLGASSMQQESEGCLPVEQTSTQGTSATDWGSNKSATSSQFTDATAATLSHLSIENAALKDQLSRYSHLNQSSTVLVPPAHSLTSNVSGLFKPDHSPSSATWLSSSHVTIPHAQLSHLDSQIRNMQNDYQKLLAQVESTEQAIAQQESTTTQHSQMSNIGSKNTIHESPSENHQPHDSDSAYSQEPEDEVKKCVEEVKARMRVELANCRNKLSKVLSKTPLSEKDSRDIEKRLSRLEKVASSKTRSDLAFAPSATSTAKISHKASSRLPVSKKWDSGLESLKGSQQALIEMVDQISRQLTEQGHQSTSNTDLHAGRQDLSHQATSHTCVKPSQAQMPSAMSMAGPASTMEVPQPASLLSVAEPAIPSATDGSTNKLEQQISDVSRKLSKLNRHMKREISTVYGSIKDGLDQIQESNLHDSQLLRENLRSEIENLQARLTPKPPTTESRGTMKEHTVERTTSSTTLPRRPLSCSTDASSNAAEEWQIEHCKLKRQIENLRRLLQQRDNMDHDALKHLSEQMQDIKFTVQKKCGERGGEGDGSCRTNSINNQNDDLCNKLRNCENSLSFYENENRRLREQIQAMKCSELSARKRYESEGEQCSWSDGGCDPLSLCKARLVKSEQTIKKLKVALKNLKEALKVAQCGQGDCGCNTDIGSDGDGRKRVCQPVDCHEGCRREITMHRQNAENLRERCEVLEGHLQRQQLIHAELERRRLDDKANLTELLCQLDHCRREYSETKKALDQVRCELLEAQRKVQCFEMRNECATKNAPPAQSNNPPCQPQQRPFSAFRCRTTDSPLLRAQLRDREEEINRLRCVVHNTQQELEKNCNRPEPQQEQPRFIERNPGGNISVVVQNPRNSPPTSQDKHASCNRRRSSKRKSRSRKPTQRPTTPRDQSCGLDGGRTSALADSSVDRETLGLCQIGSRRRRPTSRSASRSPSRRDGRSKSRRLRDKSVTIDDAYGCRWEEEPSVTPRPSVNCECELPVNRLPATTSELLGEAAALSRHLRRKNQRDFEVYGDSRDL